MAATIRVSSMLPVVLRKGYVLPKAKFVENVTLSPSRVPCRHSSYLSSKPVADISEYPEVQVVKNPPEWKYVERLMGSPTIPVPEIKADYPSGWKPPQPIDPNQTYFVGRSRNFMMPVYLHTKYRGLRRLTVVRHVDGDIWQLEKELRELIVASKDGRPIASRVNELSGQIHFHGDHVNLVKDYLLSKGF